MVDERTVETNQVVQLNLLCTGWVPWARASPHASWALHTNPNLPWVGPHPSTRGGACNIERVPSRCIMYLSRASYISTEQWTVTCLTFWGFSSWNTQAMWGKAVVMHDGWGKKEWCNLKKNWKCKLNMSLSHDFLQLYQLPSNSLLHFLR